MTIIAEEIFDLAGSDGKVSARLFAPVRKSEDTWLCTFEVSEPIATTLTVQGVSSLQAIALGLQGLSAVLYSSDLYRNGRLGSYGEFGGYLGLPAPTSYADFAPFSF